MSEEIQGTSELESPHEIPAVVLAPPACQTSATIGKLAGALAKAQLDFQPVKMNRENPYYSTDHKKAMYADLQAIIECSQKAMAANGLALMQQPILDYEGRRAGVMSLLAHESGEWIRQELFLPATSKGKRKQDDGTYLDKAPERFDAQSIGSAITYARRYSYQSIVGIAAEYDDDGNAAAGLGTKDAAKQVAKAKTGDVVPSLFYTWYNDSQTAVISGSEELKEQTANLWRKFWDSKSGSIRVNGDQLEGLKYEFEQRGIPFKQLKGK